MGKLLLLLLTLSLLNSCSTVVARKPASLSDLSWVSCSQLFTNIVTNYQQIRSGEYWKVKMVDGRLLAGYVVGVRHGRDLLVLRVGSDDFMISRESVASLTRISDKEGRAVKIVTEEYRGQKRVIHQISGLPFKNQDGSYRVQIKDLIPGFNQDSDLAIGITMDGEHAYLMADGSRFDGKILEKAKVKRFASEVDDGMVLYYKDVGADLIKKIGNNFRSILVDRDRTTRQTLHCYQGSCDILKEGLGFTLESNKKFWATDIYNGLIAGKLLDDSGKPLTFEIYSTKVISLQEQYKNLKNLQTVKLARLGGTVIVVGLVVTASGYGLVVAIENIADYLTE